MLSFILSGLSGFAETKQGFILRQYHSNMLLVWLISATSSLSGKLSVDNISNSIDDFRILKLFAVKVHVSKSPKIIEVCRHPPLREWTKCNSDGASRGNPGHAFCGGIFRASGGEILGCFFNYIGISTSLHPEITTFVFFFFIFFQ